MLHRLKMDVSHIHTHLKHAVQSNTNIPPSSIFPFLCRKFLELSLTSILARIDPIRVLCTRKIQTNSEYDPGKRNIASIAWTGDIFANESYPKDNIWTEARLKNGHERSLLGWHIGEAAITPALNQLADLNLIDSEWLRKLNSHNDKFKWLRSGLQRLYSQLSKGVHAEYLLDDDVQFDDLTIKQQYEDSYMYVCLLACATHMGPFFARALDKQVAIDSIIQIERDIIQ